MEISISGGLNFNDYLCKASEEQRKVQKDMYDSIQLSEKTKEAIKQIKEPINIIFFSESYCPDCIVALPFVKRFTEENDNIDLKIYPRKGNEEKLEEFVGTARIPTILVFDKDMEPKGAYVEFPKALLEKMAGLNVEEQKKTVVEYRNGIYNNFIEQELLDIIK